MVEARKARDKARSEADAQERAALAKYEALYRTRLENNPEWVQIEDEIAGLQRQEYSLRHRVRELTRRATQAPEVIAATDALAQAERACQERLREAVAATVEGKVALGVMEALTERRRGLERQLRLVSDTIAKGSQTAELRGTMEQCRQRRTDTDQAYRKLVNGKLRRNDEAVEIKALLHQVHTGLRGRLEKRLAEIQEAIGEKPDVAAAYKARSEASRAYEEAYAAYDTQLRTLVAAHPDAAATSAVLQEYRDATHKVREIQTTAQSADPQVISAYEAHKLAEKALSDARKAVREKAERIVANDSEGAALLRRQQVLENRLRKLEAADQPLEAPSKEEATTP